MTAESVKRKASRATRPPPERVLWFERLLYASILVSVVRALLDWSNTMRPVAFATLYLLLTTQLVLIWLAARRRRNWARWSLLFLLVAWAVTSLLQAAFEGRPALDPQAITLEVLRIAQFLLQIFGLVLAFTGKARRWFNPNLPRGSGTNP